MVSVRKCTQVHTIETPENDEHRRGGKRTEVDDENAMIALADTVVHPRAVMVEPRDALVAESASNAVH